MIKFSIVIPVYNKAKYLRASLDSVFSQTYTQYEIIAVNDGSTDESLTILKQYETKGVKILNQENKGVSSARNLGIRQAKNDYIALIDADDIWLPNHLEEHKENIRCFPTHSIFTNNYLIKWTEQSIRVAKFNLHQHRKINSVESYFKASLKDNLIWTSAVCFKKSDFLELGQFNINYKTGQDLDLWIKFALAYEIVFNATSTMIYNKGISDSLSKNEYNDIRFKIFSAYTAKESKIPWMKKYLDQKRFGLALRTKITREYEIYNNTLKLIDRRNLNFKQKILIKLNSKFLRRLQTLRDYLIQKKWFLILFK